MRFIREYRLRHRLSLVELAHAIGTSESTLCRIELGQQQPRYRLIEALLRHAAGELRAEDFFAPTDDNEAA